MKLIGLSGYARSGKDTAAYALKGIGFTRIAYADKMRDFALALNPVMPTAPMPYTRLADLVAEFGWNGIKSTPHNANVREFLQRLGTDAGRNILGENIWVDATLKGLDPNGSYVITDVRFPNEADAIRNLGGQVYRVERSGIHPVNTHISETALDNYAFDGRLCNYSDEQSFMEDVVWSVGKWLTCE